MREGIDCSVRVTKPVAKALFAAGKTFVARYLVTEKYSKHLSLIEAQEISDAGLDILSVYETTANRALSGADGGKIDGQIALECAKKVGQPKGSAIYFAVDFNVDVAKKEQLDTIEQYLKAAQSSLGTSYDVGDYGEFAVAEAMQSRDVCEHHWQTYAWSGGKRSQFANVYQYKNGVQIAGITADLNTSFGNEGFWNLRKEVKPLTGFKDVPAGHWAERAIANVKAMGIMVGLSDTEFGLGQPVTREQMASILCKFDAYIKGVK